MGPPQLIRVTGRSARVRVRAVPGATLEVSDGTVAHHPDGTVDVSSHGSNITIVCPEQSSITISTASGSVSVAGEVRSVHVVSGSGRIEVEQAEQIDVRTASGRIEVGVCSQLCRATSTSGRIDITAAAEVELSSTSGRVSVGETTRATIRTVSSRVELGATEAAHVSAHTISGRVKVRLAGSSPAQLQLTSWSGAIERRVPEGDGGARIEVSTTSGAIIVERG